MKLFVLHIILFFYTANVLKPVLPIVVDLLAHTFQELEHTNTVHAHNGEKHVHLEMQQLAKSQNDDTTDPKIEVSVTPHLLTKVYLLQFFTPEIKREWGSEDSDFLIASLSIVHPPPKC